MKRKGLIAILAAMMVMLCVSFGYADEDALQLLTTYPEDGQTNTSIENVGVKLYFNHSISGETAAASNENHVRILDPDGKEIPIKVLTDSEELGLLLVLGDSTSEDFQVQNNSEYRLVIDADFMDDDGNTLGEEKTVTFKTFNQKLNNYINMAMMFVMFGGIMIATLRQQNQQKAEQEEKKNEKKDAAFNPYREAKKTGKTVEEVLEEEKKRQEKAKKKSKKNAEPEYIDLKGKSLAGILPNVYHVSGPRPIRAAGGRYRTARGIAAAEKKAAKKGGKK